MVPLGNEAEFHLPGVLGWREMQRDDAHERQGPIPRQVWECGEGQVGLLREGLPSCMTQAQGSKKPWCLQWLAVGADRFRRWGKPQGS